MCAKFQLLVLLRSKMQNKQSSYWMQWYGSQISPFKTAMLSSHMPRALSADSLKLRPSQELPQLSGAALLSLIPEKAHSH